MRRAHRAARRAGRVITKHRSQYSRKKVRVATGMVLRTTGVVAAGAYLATRGAVVHGRRTYKRIAPHVRRIAGGVSRASYAYATVYGRHAATTVRHRAMRAVARHRVTQRRKRTLKANPGLHAALVASGVMPTRDPRIARRASALFATSVGPPRRRPTDHSSRPPRAARSAATPKDRARAARPHPTRPARTTPATTTAGGNTMSTPAVPAKLHSTNPAYHLNTGFKLAGEYEPESWVGWLQFLNGTASAFRQGSESFTQLALHMDIKRRMDPRALAGLYTLGGAIGQLGDLAVASAHTFWRLYSDRLENDGRGRVMDDEGRFFGNR